MYLFYFFLFSLLQTTNPVELEEKIGQMLMIGFRGMEVSDTSHIVRDLEKYNLGGVILFDYDVPLQQPVRNIENREQVRRLNSDLQKFAGNSLLIAIDQEGGRVARLKPSKGFLPHRSAQYLGDLDDPDSTRFYASSQADMLRNLGFIVNFAPVVDVNTNPDNPVIGSIERSFSEDPAVVTRHTAIFLEEFSKKNILGVLKHFPGHGSAWNDSHLGMADVTETWQPLELEPYKDLIKTEYTFGIMTAHVFNEHLDSEVPATLSGNVQTELLRDSLGFQGLLFSDDMQMEAIRSFYGLEESIKMALLAGVDILVFGNNSIYDSEIVPKATQIIKDLVESGEVPEEVIDKSFRRIQMVKEDLLR
ncbi:MAG: glycoside hydrolase family 3 N-terminal domain-containing protein [Balneolaceae bacterium]